MQYLIGEIGLLVLGAGFVGLVVGWLISRFFKSRSVANGQRALVDDIHRRDNEIRRLHSDLRYANEHSTDTRYDNSSNSDGRFDHTGSASHRESSSRHSGSSAATQDSRSATASLSVRGTSDRTNNQPARRLAAPAGGQRRLATPPPGAAQQKNSQDRSHSRPAAPSGNIRSARADTAQTTRREKEFHSARDNEKQGKGLAKDASRSREDDLEKRLDDETYSKIQAFAKLGESERTIANNSRIESQSPTQSAITSGGNDRVLQDYRQLMDQKNQQVDQLQQKVRDLLALKKQVAPAPVMAAVPDGAAKERERLLKASLEEESFAKVQAMASLGELESKLKLSQAKPAVDPGLAPLRRRAEQQDAIILDLRKRIEIQQSQSNVMQQEFDRKIRGREADLATLKADVSGGKSDTSQAEIDSYRRKLAESDRTHQSRIAEFNTTLEARNREYDELGNRLEDLRGKIKQKDNQLVQLKAELDTQGREKTILESSSNKYREELGGLKIAVEEKESNIVSLMSRASELERSGADVKDMEAQLSEFTRSTEASASKFESVILEQRRKLSASEQEIAALKSASVKREAELEEQLVAERNAVKDAESKKATLLADTTRYRAQQNTKEAEITQLGKDIRAATAKSDHANKEIKRLEVLAREADVLRNTLKDKQADEQRLQQLVQTAAEAKVATEAEHKKVLQAKDSEISKISTEINTSRKFVENEKGEVAKLKKELNAEKSNIAQLSKKFEEESTKQKEKIASLEPLRLKLHDSELAAEKLRKDHQLALAKSSHDLELVRSEIVTLEQSGSDQLVLKDKELAELRARTSQLHTLQSDLSKRDSQISTLGADLDKLRKQKGEYDNEIARLSKEIDSSKTEAAGLKDSLEAEKQALSAKDSELLKAHASVKQHEALVMTLKTEAQTASDGDKKVALELQGKLDVANKAHEQETAARDQQVSDLKHKVQALNALRDENLKYANDLKALNQKLAEASSAAESNRDEVSRLKSAADEARIVAAKEKETLNGELRKAKDSVVQVETMRRESDKFQTQIQGLKLEAEEKSTQYHQRIKELEPWQQKFKQADQQARDQQASIVKLKADNSADLEQKLSQAKQQNQDLLTQRDKRIADLDQKVRTLEALRHEISERDQKLNALNAEIVEARKQSTDFENRFKAAEQQAVANEGKLTSLKAEYSTKGSQHTAEAERANKEIAEFTSKLQSLDSKHAATLKENSAAIDHLKQQISEADTKAADSNKKLADARAEWELESASVTKAHESKLAEVQNDYKSQLDAQASQAEKSTGEMQSLQSKVSQLEPLQEKLTSVEAETKRLQDAAKKANDKHGAEIAAAQGRVKELEPLQAKLASHEAEHDKLQQQLKAAAEKHASEVAGLNDKLKEIESLQRKLASQEAEYNRLQESRKVAVEKSAAELGALQARVHEIEPLQRKLSQKEAELNKLQDSQRGVTEKASAEINGLLARVAELEPLQHKLSAKDAEYKKLSLEHGATADKSSAEIASLKARVQQLESLQQKLSSQEADYKKLQESHKAAADKSATETAALQGQVRELGALQQKLSARDAEFKKLEEAHKSGADKSAAEAAALQQKLSAQQSDHKELLERQKDAVDKASGEMESLQARVRELEPLQQKLTAQEAEYRKLSQEQGAAADKSVNEITSLKQRLQQLEPLQQKLASRDEEYKKLQEASKGATESASGEVASLKARIKELESLEQKLGVQEAENRKLQESQLAASDKAAAEVAALQARAQEADSLQAKLARQESSYSSLQASHAESVGKFSAEISSLKARASELDTVEDKLEAHQAANKKLQAIQMAASQRSSAELATAERPAAKKAAVTADGKKTTRKDGMDDLKLIFGIGPKIEEMLNKEGVKHFEDIARWKQADIERYSEMLVGFPDRIERDEWVLSAQQLIDGTYNWDEKRKAREATSNTAKAEPAAAAAGSAADSSSGRAERTADGKKVRRKDGMDDLKLIFGIGTKIEKMLNRKGVKTFEDIAAWQQSDIQRFSEMLEGFPDRIERDEWVQSAKEIIAGTYNWQLRKEGRKIT